MLLKNSSTTLRRDPIRIAARSVATVGFELLKCSLGRLHDSL